MAFEATVQNIAFNFEKFWLGSMKRIQNARIKLKSAGGYKADDLASDIANMWIDSADLAMSYFPVSDALMFAALSDQLTGAGYFDASGSVYLEKPAPTTGVVSTDLVWIGDPAPLPAGAVTIIPAAQVTVAPDTTAVSKLQVDATWTNANLVKGTYQGFILDGSTPIAMIVLLLY
jgi:hypothetical protein